MAARFGVPPVYTPTIIPATLALSAIVPRKITWARLTITTMLPAAIPIDRPAGRKVTGTTEVNRKKKKRNGKSHRRSLSKIQRCRGRLTNHSGIGHDDSNDITGNNRIDSPYPAHPHSAGVRQSAKPDKQQRKPERNKNQNPTRQAGHHSPRSTRISFSPL